MFAYYDSHQSTFTLPHNRPSVKYQANHACTRDLLHIPVDKRYDPKPNTKNIAYPEPNFCLDSLRIPKLFVSIS